MAGKRSRFAGDAFHHVAVAADGVDVEVEYREIGPIEVLRQPAPGDGHANTVAAALAQRAGRGLDARCQADIQDGRDTCCRAGETV